MTTMIVAGWIAILTLAAFTNTMANDMDIGLPREAAMSFIIIIVGAAVGSALAFDIYNTLTPWNEGYFAGPLLVVTLVTLAVAAGAFLLARARVNAKFARFPRYGSRSEQRGSDVIGTVISGIGLIASLLGIVSFYIQYLR